MTDQPTEPHQLAYDEDGWGPLPPPPLDNRVVIRDQTAPRFDAAQTLTRQIDQLDERRGRLPSGEVRAIVGQAAGTIEALEGQAAQVPTLLGEIELLRAELAEARGGDDAQALRLWRAGKMAEVQAAAERLYASAQKHAEGMVQDARDYCSALVADAEARTGSADQELPQLPELPEDRFARAAAVARYVDALRDYVAAKDAEVDQQLATLAAELEEAQRLRRREG